MIRLLPLLLLMTLSVPGRAQAPDYADWPVYEGGDLGLSWSRAASRLRVWAPLAEGVTWRLYRADLGGDAVETVALRRSAEGTWTGTLPGNWDGWYYTVQAHFADGTRAEVPDPQARAVGRNGRRGMIFDPAATDPDGWAEERRPGLDRPTDAVLYEAHVRDLTIHPSAGVQHPGKFLGLAERGTRSPEGEPTALDHLVGLGVTHVHFLPFFDYGSLDETLAEPGYNWGYDPLNYNAPEGTYCTDPANGAARIRELKTMVRAFHEAGIGVVMDVVYNHTYDAGASVFEQLAPGYFYRHRPDGSLSDASGCGNETASERAMVRAYIRESVRYWATEFHLDGFRFDLMGVHDQETMRLIRQDLDAIAPGLLLYGEGWTAGPSPLPEEERALKRFTDRMPGVAAFSDDFRDGIKGHWSDERDRGFASGKAGLAETVKAGVSGGVGHPQVDFAAVNYSDEPWAATPGQSVHYVSCHDNHTLFDKLAVSVPEASPAERLAMQRLALTLVLSAQGIPFLHAGTEMARSKGGDHNSYKSPDVVNAIDWNRLGDYADLADYVRGLVALRRAHPALRMDDTELVRRALRFEDTGTEHVVRWRIDGAAAGDAWADWLLIANGSPSPHRAALPAGAPWRLVGNGRLVTPEGLLDLSGEVEVAPHSAYILVR